MKKYFFIMSFLITTKLFSGGSIFYIPPDIKEEVQTTVFEIITSTSYLGETITISTVQANNIISDNIKVSTITFSDGTILVSTSSLGGGDLSTWSQYPAVSDVNMSSYAVVNVSTITFINGKSMVSIPIFAERFVAASNAPEWQKRMADYVCDGVADEVEIQQAVNEVNALGGGRVLLSAGTFYFTYNNSGINLDNVNNLIIEGQSMYSTYLGINGGQFYGWKPIIGPQTPNIYARNIVLRNFTIGPGTREYIVIYIGTCHNNWRYARAKNWYIENVRFRVGEGAAPLRFFRSLSEDILVNNCKFEVYENCYNIVTISGKNFTISNIVFEAMNEINFDEFILYHILAAENVVITNNNVDLTKVASNNRACFVFIEEDSTNVVITNNLVRYKYVNPSLYVGVHLHRNLDTILISGNVFEGLNNYLINIRIPDISGVPLRIKNVKITNNIFKNAYGGIRITAPSYEYVENLVITDNQVYNVSIPVNIDKSRLLGNRMLYLNSWETELDFDKGISVKNINFITTYQVGISTPTALRQIIVDNNYNVWISTGINNAWDWKKISQ